MSQHADATAGTVKVTVYGGDAPPYHSSNFVSIGGGPEQSDAGREVVHTFTAHTAPGEGLVKWEVVKAPRGKGNWLRPAGEQDPPGGGTPKLLGSFWARRLPPMHDCPAGSVYVRYRHAPVGSFLHRKDPDPSTSVGPSCYIDDAWRLLYALAPASIPEGGREEAAAAAAAAAAPPDPMQARIVCHHHRFNGYCGPCCRQDGKYVLALGPGSRVGCVHKQFKECCSECKAVDGKTCIVVVPEDDPSSPSQFPRSVCKCKAFAGHCGNCRVNGRNCITLLPGQHVACEHADWLKCCPDCKIINETSVRILGDPDDDIAEAAEKAAQAAAAKAVAAGTGQLRRLVPKSPELEQLAAHFCPRLWLHEDERHLPSSVDEFLSRARLLHQGEECLPHGRVNSTTLAETTHGEVGLDGFLVRDDDWELQCDDKFQRGVGWGADGDVDPELLRRIPVYCRTRGARLQGQEVVALTYCTFYPCNGAYKVAGQLLGGHEGDWEHVTVHVTRRRAAASASPHSPHSPSGPEIHGLTLGDFHYALHSVWYHCHREIDGTLKLAGEAKLHSDGHPVAYVATRGHGHYCKAGTWPRIFGTANDVCGEGYLWVPDTVVMLPELTDVDAMKANGTLWVRYPGRWGVPWPRGGVPEEKESPSSVREPGGPPAGPATQSWWRHEPCKTRTAVGRFLHFTK
eukprot:TRINITY_DN409_c0_g2_i1.p1 TRINITY_DN409_c0_g2~~TRINITY_DN409_c0_g2_i1.p1  ORF type:complete len:708 (+),score=208.41 TRINITY_DN409_c0_g2_i1:76-2124(+)